MTSQTFVIAGGGLAGAKAAAELRERGFAGRIVLACEEPEVPYERPPLTKDYLRGESERETTHVHPDGFYGAHDIDVMLETRVSAIDTHRSRVLLEPGGELGYDKLLLATGAQPRRLPVAGNE